MAKDTAIVLKTERMYLRDFNAADLDLLVELDSDPEVVRHISKGVPTSRETLETEHLPRILSWQGQSPPRGCWATHLRATDEFIGWFHLRPDKITPEEMELGYRLRRAVWGRGLATEGSLALLLKAREWGYAKVSARTLIGNLASRRVMEKAGLSFECEFLYPLNLLPDWTEAERRAVKYSIITGNSCEPV